MNGEGFLVQASSFLSKCSFTCRLQQVSSYIMVHLPYITLEGRERGRKEERDGGREEKRLNTPGS